MNMTLIKVEILHNTLYKRVRERSAKRNFCLAFSHLFFFLFWLYYVTVLRLEPML